MKIFISCGLRDHERIIGDWCYDYLTSKGHEVYWYGRVYKTRPPAQTVRDEIGKAELIIAILHRRCLINQDKSIYASSQSVHQEIGIAWGLERPIMPFVENHVDPGMLPQMTQIISFDRENPDIISEYVRQIEIKQIPEPIPNWMKILGAAAVAAFLRYILGKSKR